jgi:outer membrane murein-binding lipoprotein Lpp
MRSRKVWVVVAVVLGVVLLAAAWSGWTAYRVNKDLSAAVDDVTALRAAIEGGDDAAADRALAALEEHAGGASDRTDGSTWSMLERLPQLGDDARGVAVASAVVDDLSEQAIRPLVDASASLDALAPREGRFDPEAILSLQEPVAQAHAALEDASTRLDTEDASGYVERLRSKYRLLAREVRETAAALDTADRAVQVLPTMLGVDGARHYLLVFQNNAEIRATGGLPGAVSVLRARDGEVALTRQVAANTFGYTERPVLPLTPGEQDVYGDKLGTFFLNANLQPDFPRAAELWKARWEQVYPTEVDGVISLDPVAISYLLEATGPIEVDGTTVDSGNAVDLLLHDTYVRYPDPADQDAFFRAVARTMFDRISSGVAEPRALLSALSRGADEHRVYVHDFDEEVQSHLEGTGVAGELQSTATDRPQVGVYLSDGTGSKMSYYLRYVASVDATYCNAGVQGLTGQLTLGSEAPADAATSLPAYVTGGGAYGVPAGTQRVFVRIFGPVSGSVGAVALNGKPITGFPSVDYDGRAVFTAVVDLEPQQTADLTWRTKSGPDQDGDVDVRVTPGIGRGLTSSIVDSAC